MTIYQPDLFERLPMARNTDPDTSHQAANDATPNAQRHRDIALRLLRAAGWDGLTDFDLARLSGIQQTSIGKRRGELVERGLVKRTHRRRRTPSGSLAIVWKATDPTELSAARGIDHDHNSRRL